jgi:hypothetical protein
MFSLWLSLPEWVMTGGSAAALPCVVFGAWKLTRRIAAASAKQRAYLALGMSPFGVAGAWLGHAAGADQSLGGVILLGFMVLLVILCCLVGATVLISKQTRSLYGSIGFEVAAVLSVAGVLGMVCSGRSR